MRSAEVLELPHKAQVLELALAEVLELPLCAQVLALAISNLCGSASTCAPEVLPLAPAEVLALPHKAQVLELALAEVLELPHEAEVLALSRAQLGGSRAHTNTYSKAMILYPKGNSMFLNTFLAILRCLNDSYRLSASRNQICSTKKRQKKRIFMYVFCVFFCRTILIS